jgi:hypothetical protein
MKKPSLVNPTTSLAMGVCLLALSAGVAFADNLHPLVAPVDSNGTGQTGSNVLSSCGGTLLGMPESSPGGGNGTNSPFNLSAPSKTYAGNCGSPTQPSTCPGGLGPSNANRNTAVSQYDNACAQQALH